MNFLRPERRVAGIVAAAIVCFGAVSAAVVAAPDVVGQEGSVRELEAQIIAVDAQAAAAAADQSNALERLAAARKDVTTNTRNLKLARKNRERALLNLETRLVALYSSRAPSVAEIVLGTGDFTTALDQLDLLQRASEQDSRVLAQVKETRRQLVQSRSELIRLRKERAADAALASEKRAALDRLLIERRGVLNQARASLAQAQSAQASRLQDAARRDEQKLREQAQPGAPAPSSTPEPPPPQVGGVSTHLARIAQCESGGNPGAISSGGSYRGKYQFDYATWQSVGGSGDPAAASEAEQDKRAAILYSQRGARPWPICGS